MTVEREDSVGSGGERVGVTVRARLSSLLPAAVVSLALAAAIVAGGKVVIGGDYRTASLATNHVLSFGLLDAVWVVLLAAALTTAVANTPRVYLWLARLGPASRIPVDGRSGTMVHAALTGGLMVAWLPMLLTYAPGGVNVDALFSIRQALYAGTSLGWDNHHPVVYALFLRVWLSIGALFHSVTAGVLIATCVQFVIMAAACAYTVVWLAKRGVPTVFLVLATVFFAFVPAFPVFAVSLSNDAIFAALVLLYSLHLLDVIASEGALLSARRGLATFAALSLAIIFCRNNGVLVVLAAGVALACVYGPRLKPAYVAVAVILAFTLIVQGPVYSLFHVGKPLVEALGVPIQQLAYVVVTGGDLTQQDRSFLTHLMPMDRWRVDYAPCSVDAIKGDNAFDKSYLTKHTAQFATTWLSALVRNPGSFVNAYLLETFGYWKPDIAPGPMPGLPAIADNTLGLHRTDLFQRVTGRTLAPGFTAIAGSVVWRDWPALAWTVWMAFVAAAVLASLGKARYIVGLVPCFASWLALMLAAPVASSFRYLLMFLISLPVVMLLPLIALRDTSARQSSVPETSEVTP